MDLFDRINLFKIVNKDFLFLKGKYFSRNFDHLDLTGLKLNKI